MILNMANYHTINGCNLKFILVRTKQTPTLNHCAIKRKHEGFKGMLSEDLRLKPSAILIDGGVMLKIQLK